MRMFENYVTLNILHFMVLQRGNHAFCWCAVQINVRIMVENVVLQTKCLLISASKNVEGNEGLV